MQMAATARGVKVSSPAFSVLEASVPAWVRNGIASCFVKTPASVSGMQVAALGKRRFAGYHGGFTAEAGGWKPAGADAMTAPGFLRSSTVVRLLGYSGNVARPAFPAQVRAADAGEGGRAAGAADNDVVANMRAELDKLRKEAELNTQKLDELQQRAIDAEDSLKQFSESGGAPSQQAFSAVGTGSVHGTLTSRQGFEIGKTLLVISQVFGEASAAAKQVTECFSPGPCSQSTPGRIKDFKLVRYVLAHDPMEVPDDMLRGLQEKFTLFFDVLKTYGSSNLLPADFYKASDWLRLFRRLINHAGDAYEAIVARGDGATARRTPLSVIIREADVLVTVLLHKAILRHSVVDLDTSNDACLSHAFQSVEPRGGQSDATKRAPDAGARDDSTASGAATEKRSKSRETPSASEVCLNFNLNRGSCKDSATVCKNGRKHVCSKCGAMHAKFATAGCK